MKTIVLAIQTLSPPVAHIDCTFHCSFACLFVKCKVRVRATITPTAPGGAGPFFGLSFDDIDAHKLLKYQRPARLVDTPCTQNSCQVAIKYAMPCLSPEI